MTEGRPILAEYCRAGFALVPIPHGQKRPVTDRWNTRELCVTDPALAEWLDGNIGLAHAYSGTCALDVDDLARAVTYLGERGIDLSELLEAPDAVRVESRAGRTKLLYRLTEPLPSYNLKCIELRCATANGLTVQDVLPPSIHPDTHKPYEWAFGSPAAHWSALPMIPGNLLAFWQSLMNRQTAKPARDSLRGRAEAGRLRELLAHHDPDAGYDDWIAVGMALHHETRGAPVGLALWNEWSSTGQKYRGLGDLETHWRSFRVDRDNPRTLATLERKAPATSDEFPDLSDEPSPRLPNAQPAPSPAVADGPRLPGQLPDTPLTGAARDRAIAGLRGVRRGKLGTIEARISNVVAVLSVPEMTGADLALDEFLDAVMIREKGNEWRPFLDSDYTSLRVWLETAGNCDPIGHEMMRHAVTLVAERQRFDTAQLWLRDLEWDGIERIDHFCPLYLGTLDEPYERAVGRYLWTAIAGRVMQPGCQVDMVPVLIGKQGVGKSRGVQAMVPMPDHYVELRLDEPDDAIARKMRGTLVAEFAEMRGLRAADVERVKAFITRTHEKWVPKYKEFATNYARRFLIIGTTNDEEFLPADTEHRRWLPVHVDQVRVDQIAADRDQLWAEGLHAWRQSGVAWRHLDQLAKPAREKAAVTDSWQEDIATWLDANPAPRYRIADILTNALGIDSRSSTRAHELRVGRVLHALGYVRKSHREKSGRVVSAWVFDPTS